MNLLTGSLNCFSVLLESKNIVISRETLLEKVCGYDYLGETNIIDVYVRYLQQ